MTRSPLAVAALSGLVASAAVAVAVTRADDAPAVESTRPDEADASRARIADLRDERQTLVAEANELRAAIRKVDAKLDEFERMGAQQRRRINRLEAELSRLA